MKPEQLSKELYETTRYAIRAIPWVPDKSYYKDWIYQLIAEEIEAYKYQKLRRKLLKFWREEWVS